MELKKLPISSVLIMVGVLDSLIYIYVSSEGTAMSTEGIIAIVIALIGVAGGIWVQIVQFKKDSGKISDIKSDTQEMKPTINNIDDNVKTMQKDVMRNLTPKIDRIAGIESDTKVLVDELNYQKRLKSELSSKALNKDYFIGEINELYEENARLSMQLKEQIHSNQKLIMENSLLQSENIALKKERQRSVHKEDHSHDELER